MTQNGRTSGVLVCLMGGLAGWPGAGAEVGHAVRRQDKLMGGKGLDGWHDSGLWVAYKCGRIGGH